MAVPHKFETIPGAGQAAAPELPRFAVRHYSVAEIAAMWNLSDEAVRGIFHSEPDVLVLGDVRPRGRKRRYTTLRIPEFVVDRVHRRLSRV